MECIATRYQTLFVTAVVLVIATGISFIAMAEGAREAEALREIRLVVLEPVAFLLVVLYIIRSKVDRQWLVAGVAAAGVMASVGAFAQLAGFGSGVTVDSVTRLTGPYSHPNNLALLLERCALLALPAVFLLRGAWRVVAISATGVMALGLLMTFSRGGWLAFAVGVLVILVLLQRFRWLLWALIAAIMASLSGLVLFRERLLDLGGSGNEPTRFAIWRSAWDMIADHPWTGVGPDQFLYQYGRRYVEPAGWPERYTSHPHNLLLDFWVRLGAAGLVALGLMVYAAGKAAHRFWGKLGTDWVRLGALAAFIGAATHGLIDNFYFLPDLALLDWTLLALLWIEPGEAQSEASIP